MGGGRSAVEGTISLSEASRFGGSSTAFSLMLKPVGSRCNLRCDYCYYLDKSALYGGREPVMDLRLLEIVMRSFCEGCDLPELTVEWHGGEPLLAGMDFYRRALALERKYAGGRPVHNTLQTNGTLLTPGWAAFFRDNGFLLGLSLDGPEDIHDRYRRTAAGGGTFSSVMRGLETLLKAGTEFNTLTTVSRAGQGRGAEVYRFLKAAGSRYMQLMPVYEHIAPDMRIAPPVGVDSVLAPWSVDPEAFGRYLCDIFDLWVRGDVGKYFVLTFDAALSSGIDPLRTGQENGTSGKMPALPVAAGLPWRMSQAPFLYALGRVAAVSWLPPVLRAYRSGDGQNESPARGGQGCVGVPSLEAQAHSLLSLTAVTVYVLSVPF